MRRRLEIINRYGGSCWCCGETRWEFLALDHKNGGGNKERVSGAYSPGNGMYWWLKKRGWPTGFRIACHNCNSAVAFHGACPHRPTDSATIWTPCPPCVGKRGKDLCPDCLARRKKAWVKQSCAKLRLETFETYGGKCACCSESRTPFLTFDHIEGGGNKDRLEKLGRKSAAGLPFYRMLRKNGFPKGFRILCWNCQLSIGYYGYCAHKPNG
jgi:hypothetical protein